MRLRASALAALACTLSASIAQAHDFIEGAGAFNGVLHPLLVPSHALCLLGCGLMCGQQDDTGRMILTALFPVTMIAGILLIIYAIFPIDLVPAIVLASGAAAGLLTAWARPLPVIVPALILAAAGLSLIIDSVPSVVSKLDTILALLGTLFTATLVLVLLAWLIPMLTRDWQKIGVRILGSWTAASALMVLALMVAR